jgi:hypothetical protein
LDCLLEPACLPACCPSAYYGTIHGFLCISVLYLSWRQCATVPCPSPFLLPY